MGYSLAILYTICLFSFLQTFFWGQALAVYRKDVCGRNMLMFFPHLIVFAVRSISNHVYVWSCLFKCSLCKRTCFDTSCIHHKTGPLLCHYRCSLLASCCSKFFLWSALPLASFLHEPMWMPNSFQMKPATRQATWVASTHACSGKSQGL